MLTPATDVTSSELIRSRLHLLGCSVRDMERTYCSSRQIEQWALTWTCTVQINGVDYPLRAYCPMKHFARIPLINWAFTRFSEAPTEIELFAEQTPQKPPWWLSTWPRE